VDALEVAILDRSRALPRKFRRITGDRLAALLRDEIEPEDPGTETPPHIPPEPPVPETVLGESP
jgi:proteasome alpha subunit